MSVPNDVFEFNIRLKRDIVNTEVTIYTSPLKLNDDYTKQSDLVQSKYFTKEKILELKQELIKKIIECENPFEIECTDYDGDYNVTEEQLFKID